MTDFTISAKRRPEPQSGFSLIEVLISMLLALITFLVMFQMFESWDRSKRSTASGGGAMISGALAMFRLERDLRLAGFGFGNAPELGCCVEAFDTTRTAENLECALTGTASATRFSFPLVALQINDGASGAPDQLVVMYGSSEGASTTRFFGTSASGAQPYTEITSNTAKMEIGARGGIQQGDMAVIAQDSGACNLVEITDTSASDRRTIGFTGGNYTHFYTGALNTAPRYYAAAGIAPSGATGRVYVLGPRLQRRIWQIRNSRTLAYSNDVGAGTGVTPAVDTHADLTDVADNIVNLQAQYGIATPSGNPASATCTPVTNPTWQATAPGTACEPFVWAVRVALLARSDQFEKSWGVPAAAGAAVAPSWAGGSFTMTNIDGTADSYTSSSLTSPSKNPNDWRHYRYKVFESIIPLKNVMWGSR